MSPAAGRRLALVLVLTVLGSMLVLLSGDNDARSSTLSRGGRGWWAFFTYAAERGHEVRRLDRPLAAPEDQTPTGLGAGVLVLGFPWQTPLQLGESDAIRQHLRDGGDVVIGYHIGRFEPTSGQIWSALGTLGSSELRGDPPLAPLAWWNFQGERWTLPPAAGFAGPTLELAAVGQAPGAPPQVTVLYQAPAAGSEAASEPERTSRAETQPLVFLYRRFAGRVLVLPAGLLSNAELEAGGNADLMATLLHLLDPQAERTWWFDEFHHGLVDPQLHATSRTAYAWDLFVLHLLLVYGLGVWLVARPFGRTWSEPAPHHGSTAAFLHGLGTLHHRLGHHAEAARLLVERALALDRRLARDGERLAHSAEDVTDGPGLVELGRRLATAGSSPRAATSPTPPSDRRRP